MHPLPEHGPNDGIQRYFYVKFVGTGELNVNRSVTSDYVSSVVGTFNPDCIFVHDMGAVGLRR